MIGRTTKKCFASIFQGNNIGTVYKGNRRELKDDQVIPKVTVLVVHLNEEEIKKSDFTHLRYYDQTNYVPFTKTIYYPRQQQKENFLVMKSYNSMHSLIDDNRNSISDVDPDVDSDLEDEEDFDEIQKDSMEIESFGAHKSEEIDYDSYSEVDWNEKIKNTDWNKFHQKFEEEKGMQKTVKWHNCQLVDLGEKLKSSGELIFTRVDLIGQYSLMDQSTVNSLFLCDDLIHEILTYLQPYEIGICSQTAKNFQRIALQKKFWKNHISKLVEHLDPFYIYKMEQGSREQKIKVKYQIKYKTKNWAALTKKQKEKILYKECKPIEHPVISFGRYMFRECNWIIKHDYFNDGVSLEIENWKLNCLTKDCCELYKYRLENWMLKKGSREEKTFWARNRAIFVLLFLSIPVVLFLELLWFLYRKLRCKKN
eukprot:gene8892-842_t